jgi:hypothetical protein
VHKSHRDGIGHSHRLEKVKDGVSVTLSYKKKDLITVLVLQNKSRLKRDFTEIIVKNDVDMKCVIHDLIKLPEPSIPAVDYSDLRYMFRLSNKWKYRRFSISGMIDSNEVIQHFLMRNSARHSIICKVSNIWTSLDYPELPDSCSSLDAKVSNDVPRIPSYVGVFFS